MSEPKHTQTVEEKLEFVREGMARNAALKRAMAGIADPEEWMEELKGLIDTASELTWDKPSKNNVSEASEILGEALALFPKQSNEGES